MRRKRARPFLHCALAKHWGDSGGTPADKDKEIRVRTGKSKFQLYPGHGAPTGVLCRGYVENKGDVLAPQSGHVSNFCGINSPLLEPVKLSDLH